MAVARRRTQGAVLASMLLAMSVHAQQATPVPADDALPATAEQAGQSASGQVTTLGEVRALKPEDETPVNLYRFKNPVQPESNRFSRSWSEPPTPEQVSLAGGYLMMGVVKGLTAAGRGLNKVTGGPDQVQPAVARPPPQLSDEERRRARSFCDPQQVCGVD